MSLLVQGNNPAAIKTAERNIFTATAGQTLFNIVQGYQPGDIDVFLNGVRLVDGEDFSASNSVSVTLISGASVGDSVVVVCFRPFQVADFYTKSEQDARYVNTTGDTITGTINLSSGRLYASGNPSGEAYNGLVHIRDVNATGSNDSYSSIAFSSSPGADFSIGKYTNNGTGYLNIRNNNDLKLLQMTSTGQMTLPGQPAFYASKQGGSVNASTGAGIVSFSNTMHDKTNSWNGSRFTAPVSGTYNFIFEQMYHHEGGDITFQILKNGATVSYNNPYGRDSQGYAETWSTNSVHWLGNLNVGDYVEFNWASGGIAATTLYGLGLYTKALGFYLG